MFFLIIKGLLEIFTTKTLYIISLLIKILTPLLIVAISKKLLYPFAISGRVSNKVTRIRTIAWGLMTILSIARAAFLTAGLAV